MLVLHFYGWDNNYRILSNRDILNEEFYNLLSLIIVWCTELSSIFIS